VTLNPPSQPSGPTAHPSRPDPEALLLEAVRQRRRHDSLDRLQRCVHRRGLDWLHQFQTLTLPALEGHEAALWFAALLEDGSGHSAPGAGVPRAILVEFVTTDDHLLVTAADPLGGGEHQAWIEQRATEAVDGAIASMLAEFPELVPPGPSLGSLLPLTVAPTAPPVPEVLPARKPPPVFSFARAVAPLEPAAPQPEPLPGDVTDGSGEEGLSHLDQSAFAAFSDDPAPLEGQPADSAAPWQRNAAKITAALGSRLLRRLSRTDWRTLESTRPDREAAPLVTEPAPVSVKLQGPVASSLPDGAAAALPQDDASWDLRLARTPDSLAVVVQLAERQSGLGTLEDAAPAPPALADLRAWLPDSSLPRAS